MENYSTTNGQQDSFPRGQSNGIDLPTPERNNNGGSSSTAATAAVVNIPTTFAALLDSFPLPVLSEKGSATQHDISGSNNPHPMYSNNHHRANVAATPPTTNVSLLPSSSLRASSSDSIIPNPSELLLRSPSQAARAVDDHFAAIRTSSEQTPVSTSSFGPAAAVTTPDKSLSYHHGGHNSHSMPAKKRVGQRQQSPLTTASTPHSAYSPLPPSSPSSQTHTRSYVDRGNKGNHSSTTGSDNSVSPSSANTMSPRITTTAHHHSHPRTHPHNSSLTSKRSRPPVAAIDIPQKKMKMAQLDTSLPVNTSEQDASANQGTQRQQQQNCNQGTEAVSPPASQLSYQFHQFANQMMTRFEQMLTIQSEYYKKMFSTLDEALYRIAKVESKVAELEKKQAVDPSSVKMELHEMETNETNETTEALKPPQ